jgi:6-pyruvoyl-tetrahydropterin synthase
VCYETNFRDARARKEEYTELVEEVEENGFVMDLITVEVGSREFVNYESFSRLNSTLGHQRRNYLTSYDLYPVRPSRVVPNLDM